MEFIGKTLEDAINTALDVLKANKEELEIKILEEPTKGLFGRLKGKAVIDVNKKTSLIKQEKTEEQIKEEPIKKDARPITNEPLSEKTIVFVQKLIDFLDMGAIAEVIDNNVIVLKSEQTSPIIGHRGEVLDAIQTLAGAVENIGKKNYKKVVVDCENYRERREDTLIKLAKRLETKAVDMKREVILEPMNPFERRIIHTALASSTLVSTRSDGKEPNRYVVIVPNEKDEFSKPFNAGRNNSKKRAQGRDNKKNTRTFKSGTSYSSGEKRKKPTLTFGTYLGNSLKDNK